MARFGFGLGFGIQGFAPIFGSESRNFTTLDSAGTKSYTIPSISSFTGALVFNFDFALSGTPLDDPVYQFGESLCRIDTDTRIEIWGDIGGGSTVFTVPSLGNKLHNASIEVTAGSDSVTLILDGVSQGTQTSGLVFDFTGAITRVGGWSGGNYDGVIANFKITDAGTLKRFYKIDETWADDVVLKNSAGNQANLVTNGDFSGGTTTGWTALSDASLSVVSGAMRITNVGANFGKAYQEIAIDNSKEVSLMFDNIGGTSDMFYRVGSTPGDTDIVSNQIASSGITIEKFTTAFSTIYVTFVANDNTDGLYAQVDDISVDQANNGTAVNITSSDSETFTKSGDDWLGVELVTNGGFDTDSDWNKGAGWTISGGEANGAATSVNINQSIGSQLGNVIRVEFDITSFTSGTNFTAEIGGTQGLLKSDAGFYTTDITPINGTASIFLFGGNVTLSFDNITAKRILEGA